MNARGVVLLETMVALTILAVIAVSVVGILRQARVAVAAVIRSEAAARDADRLLTAITLMNRDELNEAAGTRTIGGYILRIDRRNAALYDVRLMSAEGLMLATVLYRRPEVRR